MTRSKDKYILNSPISLLSTVLLAVFLVPVVVLPFVNVLGGFGEIITDLIDLIPFGEAVYYLAIEIVSAMTGEIVNFSSLQGVFTVSYAVQELAEGIFTVIIYEALCQGAFMIMGLAGNVRGRWNNRKRWVIRIAMAVIAACLAPALINWTFANMSGLGKGLQFCVSGLISLILLGGGTAFFVFLYGFAISKAIVYMVLKFLLLGALRLAGSYIFLMVLLIGCEQQVWSLIISGMSGFMAIILILAGIELMIEPIFK